MPELSPGSRGRSLQALGVRVALLAAGLLVGCLIFLTRVPAPELPLGQQILGDEGDGLLTLWCAEHVRLWLDAARWQDALHLRTLAHQLADARIFWPEHANSYYWTTPLFVPGVLHALLVALGATPIASFFCTSILALGLGICVLALTFWCIAEEVLPELHPAWGVLFAVSAALSPSAGLYFIHPQNPWGFAWVGIVTVPILLRRGRVALASAVMGALLALFISTTPYFFVMAFAYLVCMLALIFREIPLRTLLQSRAAWTWIVLFALPSLYFARRLWRVELAIADPTVHELSSDLWHFATPTLVGSVLGGPWQQLGPATSAVSHESPAYLGIVGIAALLFAIGSTLRRLPRWIWIAALIPLAWKSTPIDLSAWRSAVVALLVVLFWQAGRSLLRERADATSFSALQLVLVSFFFLFFLCLGPQELTLPVGAVDASAWGILAAVVPGFHTMRAIGRYSLLAKFLLLIWGTLSALLFIRHRATRQIHTVLWSGALALALALNIAEGQVPLYGMPVEPQALELLPEEEAAFGHELHGVAAVFPVGPDYENAKWMLKFKRLRDVALVNGYSSKTSQLWQHLREVQSGPAEQPSAEEARRLCAAGVDHLVRAGSPERAAPTQRWRPVPGGRFWVASCKDAS